MANKRTLLAMITVFPLLLVLAVVGTPGQALAKGPTFVQVNPPLPFIPFTAKEFRLPKGKTVKPETVIKMPDGTTRTVAQALARLNKLEKALAASGSTLRGGIKALGKTIKLPNGKKYTKKPAAFVAKGGYKAFDNQRDAYNSKYKPSKTSKVESPLSKLAAILKKLDELEKRLEKIWEGKKPPAGSNCVDDPPYNRTDSWSWSLGTAATFRVSLSADTRVAGDKTRVLYEGKASAGGSVFGAGFSLFEGSGKFRGPAPGASGTPRGTVHVSVRGNTLVDFSDNTNTSWQGNKSDSFKKQLKIPLINPLGIIKVEARVGVKGKAGMVYRGAASTGMARGALVPNASSKGFAMVVAGPKIDLGIAKAKLQVGVIGTLTFLEDNLALAGLSSCVQRDCYYCNYWYRGDNTMAALAGKMKLFAEAEACVLGACVGDRWTWLLFQWNGIGPNTGIIFQGTGP